MQLRWITTALVMAATAALAQTTPGDQFLQNWDLNQDGTATLEELREMRGNVFLAFDANEDGYLDAEEYVLFDEARAYDVANYQAEQRAQMQQVADGTSMPVNDLDGDGRVAEAEFLSGAATWFEELDTDGDGGITLEDFAR